MAIIKAVSSKSQIKMAIAYVSKKEKTEQKLLSGYNLSSPETAYEEMQATKELWNKVGGRTYKHYVQSFAPDETITPEQAHAIAKEFVEQCQQFKGFEVLIATHQDREHVHTHFLLNSVNFEDGHKFQQKSTELQAMKDLSDEICLEHGLSLTQKGRTFDGEEREETTAYKKEQYRLLQRAEQGEVKSYVQNIALAVMECREQAQSREQFIELMNANGYGIVWTNEHKHITFIDLARQKQGEKQCKVRNSKLEKYYHTDFSKEGLENEFANNARKQQEEYKQASRVSAIAKHGRAVISDTGAILEESRTVLNQSTIIGEELRLNRDDTRTTLRRAETKVKSSEISRNDRENERERLRVEESRRIAEQAERERKSMEERSKKKSRGSFER